MARLVNKQFNSPIGLYSQQNIQDVLDRESQMLANGAVGIDFNDPSVGKPANLKNSAVLRMLEEEENRQRNGYGPGSDRILKPLRAWPPPEYDQKNQLRSTFKDVVTPGVKRVAWPPPHEFGQGPYSEQNAVPAQGGPQYPSQAASYQNNYQQQPPAQSNQPSYQQQRAPLKLDVSQGGSSPLASPLSNQSPQTYRAPTPSKGWASVQSPVTTPNQPAWRQNSPTRYQAAHQPVSQQAFLGQQYSGPQGNNQPALNQYQPQQQYHSPQQQYQSPQQQYQSPQQQYQSPQQQYQSPQQQYQSPQQQYQAPQQQYQAPQQQYQSPQQQYQAPQQQYQPPQQQYQAPQQQYQAAQTQTPQSPYQSPSQYSNQQQYQTQTTQYQYSQQHQSSERSYQSQPQYQSSQGYPSVPQSPQVQSVPIQVHPQAPRSVEPPPSTITLRPQAPVSQAPPPVYTSQPATATLKGGKHLRGDMKWPPEEVKLQAEEENRLRLELARGPVCRPRRVNKDYTSFFEQHALNSAYPGYKIPPGTQFYRQD